MGHNHHHDHPHDDAFAHDRRILWIALVLNFLMFMLEIWQGMKADSTALIADSMDFLSDSCSYGITIYVLTKTLATRAKASLLKAWMMVGLGLFATTQGIGHMLSGAPPAYSTMGWVATLALVVNLFSARLLYASRGRDSNMRAVWLCSRNDALNNIAVLAAAGLVFYTNSLWPDLAVAAFIAWIETKSALMIMREARTELKDA